MDMRKINRRLSKTVAQKFPIPVVHAGFVIPSTVSI
jgi:hypothetical protein